MPIDDSLVGRVVGPTPPYAVTQEAVASFAGAVGEAGHRVPPTFPIVVVMPALLGLLEQERVELARIIHGDQKFAYERPVRLGDELRATVTITAVRRLRGSAVIRTSAEVTDAGSGELVCTTASTLVHREEETL